MKKFTTETEAYFRGQGVESKCNEIAFINKGNQIARVDGMPLLPGEYIIDGGETNEYTEKVYKLEFESQSGNPLVHVRRKTYLK